MNQAALMLIIKDGLILSVSRKNDNKKWGLIGGKVNSDETIMEAAIRETKEESNIDVEACTLFFYRDETSTTTGKQLEVYCYFALLWAGEPSSSEEGSVMWKKAAELTSKESGAFSDYNTRALDLFGKQFPLISLEK